MASALALTMLSGFAVSATPFVLDGPGAVPADASATRLLASPAESGSAFYTVLLREAPLATYAGEIAGLAAPERLLRGSAGGKLDLESAAAVAYVNHLRSRQDAFVAELGASVGRTIAVRARMQHALNAVIVELTSSEAAALSQNPAVLVVEREHQLHLDTDNAPTFTGAPAIWDGNTSSGAATKGEGIVVGVIDTGINWQSPAYAAVGPIDGYVHQNPRGTGNYLGLCGATAPNADLGRCNDKLIGMYNFADTSATRSGQDTQGHGSHTSSTVAGNRWNATFASGPFTISGVAPHANIISYLACPSTCPSTATSQSVNQAVIDGVDVLNYSISGGTSPWTDTTSIAFRNANAAGMFVATSAGNTSTAVPNPQGQVNHMEPWVETVAASTQNRVIAVTFDLDGGPANTQDIPMRTGAPPLPTSNLVGRPVIKSPGFANGATDSCTAFPAGTFTAPYTVPAEEIFKNGFDEPTPPPTTVGGIAVLRLDPVTSTCASGVRRTNAINAGAVGVIFVDAAYINLGAADTSWSMLLSNWNDVEAALVPGTSTGSVDIAARAFPATGDLVAGFSFRGPRLVGGQGMVKPDITAPGVDILAVGAANVVGPNGVYLNNGTSMSSPHMAGAAALMRALNPSWTPPQIKSALNLSSNNFGAANQDGTPIRLWDYGSGRVNLTSAAKVGLIMDETAANFLAANPATGGDIASLNLASMAKYNFTGSTTFTRTFRRAKAGSQTYTLGLAGLPAGAATFSPASFSINSSGSRTVTVTVDSALLPEAAWTLGELILTPGTGDEPTLHLPIAVYPGGPQIAVSPSSLSGSSDTTVTNNLTISNTANPTLNWQFQTTGTAVVTPFNAGTTGNGQQAGLYSGPPARGYHWAQNFDVAGQMRVTTLRANGFTLPAAATLTTTNTTGVTFSIYADNAGNPAGATEGFGAPPLWTYTATIGAANGITTTGGAVSLNLNATNVVGNPLNLPAGRYWLSVSPRINGTGAQTTANPLWAWYVSDAPLVGSVPKLYAPWSDPLAFSTAAGLNTLAGFVQGTVDCTKPTWVDLTTTSGSLGLAGSQSVPVTFNAAGLGAGTYTGSLCVTSNATNTPVVSVPLTFTVPNGGSQAPTVTKAFAPASISAGGTSALTITLANAGPTASTLSAPLVDTFPADLVVAATPAAATTCPSGVVTAVAGAGSVSLAAGAQIPATGSCTVTVNVSSAIAGSYVNTIAAGALQTSSGNNAAPATATLGVTVVTYTVTPSSSGNGTIAPATPQIVNSGNTTNFALTPNSGYQIGTVGGTCGGTLSAGTFTTAAVTADCTVIANFTLIPPLACASGQPVEVVATAGTPGPTPYTTLKGAFDAINAGTHTGALDVSICANTTETASAVLNASGTGSAVYTAATIKPAGGASRTISGDIAGALVDLNGADNVTIDGLNSGGNALTLSNTSTATTAGTSTIRFIEGAMTNTVTRTSILGSSTGGIALATGNVVISTSTVAGGNSSNTLSDNNIGPAGANLPSKAITLLGSATPLNNVGNTITGNRISDFFLPTGATAGINVQANNDTTTISNNRLFQTAPRTFTATTAGARYSGILVNSATFTTNVTGNVIGFGAADGTGTTTITGTGTTGLQNEIRGIVFTNAKQTTPFSTVSGNTISGINQTTTRASTTAELASFIGIHSGSSADAPADITGNTIGSLDGSSTIVVNAGSVTANTAAVTGVLDYNFIGGLLVSGNNVGSITINNNAGVGSGTGFRGINVVSTTGVLHSVTNNIVGGPTAAGGIVNNLVGSNSMFGIQIGAASGTVTGNTVRNMSGNANNAAVVMSGIFMSGSNNLNPSVVARNTVHSLRNSSTTGAAGASYAIDLALPGNAGNLVERNLVHSIWTDSTFNAYQFIGLILRGTTPSTTTVRNNMIRLGFDANGVAMVNPYPMTGIRDSVGTGVANNYYNNSVYIGGSGVVGSTTGTVNTFALNSDTVTTARNFQNNILWNARSNAAAGGAFHVAARFAGTVVNPPGVASDYNVLFANGTGGQIGLYNGFVYPTLATWRAATGVDANSVSADPQFIAPTGTAATGDLHISPTNPTPVEGTGLLVASVTDDFDGDVRSGLTPTDIGADAGNFVVLPQFTVTPSVTGGNGTISPATVQTVFSGGTASFTLTADSGYQIGAITGTCGGTLAGTVYTTNAVTSNCTVIASFTSTGFTVTPSVSGGNGSISPNTPQTVASGATTAFTLTPDAGFAIGPVTGTCPVGSLSGGVYTTGAITANCTVIASFTQITYTVTPSTTGSALEGVVSGTIAPSTPVTVNQGATTTFTITPASGYNVASVGGSCPLGTLTGTSYVTGAIVADCTVIANFAINTYSVTPSVSGGNGTISPAMAQTVNHNGTTSFTLTPDADYVIGPVTGTCGGSLSGSVYTTAPVTAACTVIASFTPVFCQSASPVEVKASAGTAGPTGYASLGAAFAAINTGTHQGTLDVRICGDTTEATSASLAASGTGSALYTSALIKPAGGAARTISGAIAADGMVILNGADNVTIDGVNAGGNALTISNTSTAATSGTSTIRFIGGATGNTITNSSILGSATMPLGTNGGTFFFSTDALTTNGNDNNTISNNNIGPAGANLPTKAIYANGSTTNALIANSGNLVNNNNIFDFFNAATSVSGVHVLAGNSGWSITNNRLYQTAARTFTVGSRYAGITLNAGAANGGFVVTGNRIGFGAADGTGTTSISGLANTFRGVDIVTLSSTVATTVDNNIVSGINQTTTSTSTSTTAPFIALMLGSSDGLINGSGNTIGSLDGSSTIVLNLNGTSGGSSLGIYNFTSFSTTLSANQVGAITVQGTGTTAGFTPIYAWTGGGVTTTMTNNIIGGPTAAGAITSTHAAAPAQATIGLRTQLSNSIVTGNTVRNLIGATTITGVVVEGISVSTTSTAASNISGNTIHSLANNAATGTNSVVGIDASFGTGASTVQRNNIHSLGGSGTTAAALIGVLARAGTATYSNNMIRLGLDAAGGSITTGNTIAGMNEIGGTNGFFHNSVYVGGTGVVSVSNTNAFTSSVSTGTRSYQNNIFWNARSNASGTGKNYAIAIGGTTVSPAGVTSSNNLLLATGTGGLTGLYNLVDQTTLLDWQTATGVDAASFATNPQFIAPNGTAVTGDLHINPAVSTPVEATGTPIAAVTVDFDGETRSGLTPTDVGADAGNFIP